jgi:uncharacterized damage-inducible protein DinB
MLVNDIQTLYKYNYWAHHRLFNIVKTVPDQEYQKDLGSSHGGLHGTLVHIMSAEEIWLKRWKGEPTAGLHKPEEFKTFDAITDYWKKVESSMTDFCEKLRTDNDLERRVTYKDIRGNSYTQLLSHMMLHMINHSTYHRGQIVTMLRQLNITPVSTDLIGYYREMTPASNVSQKNY